jgi:YHS domain-containing protein
MRQFKTGWRFGLVLLVAGLGGVVRAVDPVPATNVPTTNAAREQLARLNPLIGGWRGVGQPLRGSNKGAWTETADWVWNLRGESPAIDYVVTEGKLLKQASLTWNVSSKRYELSAVLGDGTKRLYTGDWEAGKLVLTAGEAGGVQQRVIVTPLNEKRTLVFFGEKAQGADEFRRVAEVGYTRAGTRLAVEGAGELVCIVTGGKGTSTVTYKGQTYYVCCSGCRDAFNDDPEGVLAEAAERAKKK